MDLSEINFVKINNFLDAYDWLNQFQDETIIIPLQPLVVNNQPNILPIQYFIPPDPDKDFEKYHLLLNEINLKAPKNALSKKAIQQLTQDLLNQNQSKVEQFQSIDWLSSALSRFLNHSKCKKFQQQETQKVIEIANWINQQYQHVLFFGWDDHYINQIDVLTKQLNKPISWLVPSSKNESRAIQLMDFISLNKSKTNNLVIKNQGLNLFQTPHEEVKQVLHLLKQRQGQTVVVIPNEYMRAIVQSEAIQQSIDIADEPLISLDQTHLGKMILAAINYMKKPFFEELKEVVFSYDWPDNQQIKLKINTIEKELGFSGHFKGAKKRLMDGVEMDHFIHRLIGLKTIEDLIELTKAYVKVNNEDQQTNLIYQHLEVHLNRAKDHSHPMNYLEFMLKKSNILKPTNALSLICITPESICRYPDYPLWIMGLGDKSWSIGSRQSYLTIDSLNDVDHEQELRLGLAVWGVTHPKLIGLSMAEFVNKQQDHLLEGIELPMHRLENKKNHKVNFHRKQPIIKSKPKALILSPSKLQLYQRCPYAFFLKYKLGLSSMTEKSSDHQMIGIILHRIIEELVHNKNSNELFILEWTKNHLNPLMAKIIQTKLANEWPIHDFISFCHQYNGMVKTEEPLSMMFNDQKIEGRADIIIENETEVELIDIKTGKPASKTDMKNHEDIQLGLYILMMAIEKPINAHYFLKKNQLKTMIKAEDEGSKFLLDGVKERVLYLINAINAGQFLPDQAMANPSHHANQCRVCDYYKICHSERRHQR